MLNDDSEFKAQYGSIDDHAVEEKQAAIQNYKKSKANQWVKLVFPNIKSQVPLPWYNNYNLSPGIINLLRIKWVIIFKNSYLFF